LCDERNLFNNVIKIIDKYSILNGIKANKNKSSIIVIKNYIKEKHDLYEYLKIRKY